MSSRGADIIQQLQSEILRFQGFRPNDAHAVRLGLPSMEAAFPQGVFPTGAVHELLPASPADAAAAAGFLVSLLVPLMQKGGVCLWVSAGRKLFPPSLQSHGLEPDRVIFADLKKEKDVLWAMNEALHCSSLVAVVGELKAISFAESRRLQLAVEESRATGFIMRQPASQLQTTACVSRWRIASLASEPIDDLPGIGSPRWHVELLRIRNGRPGAWKLHWRDGKLQLAEDALPTVEQQQQTG